MILYSVRTYEPGEDEWDGEWNTKYTSSEETVLKWINEVPINSDFNISKQEIIVED